MSDSSTCVLLCQSFRSLAGLSWEQKRPQNRPRNRPRNSQAKRTRPCTHAVHSGPSMQSGQCRQPAQGFEACPCQGLLSVIMHNNNELRMKFELSFTVHSPSIHSVFMHAQFRGCIQSLVPRNFPSFPVHVASRSAQLF